VVAECVVDTVVLQAANAPLKASPRAGRTITSRIRLLRALQDGKLVALYSEKLLLQYREKLPKPRNDFVRAFLELLTGPGATPNWSRLTGAQQDRARKCRFPHHDLLLLQTAFRKDLQTTIFTEDGPMLKTDKCILRYFRVHVLHPQTYDHRMHA